MITEKISDIVCDTEGCSGIACIKVSLDKNSKNGLKLCKNCILKLHSALGEYLCKKVRK